MRPVLSSRRSRVNLFFDIFATKSAKMHYISAVLISVVSALHIQCNSCYIEKDCYVFVLILRSVAGIFDLCPWISLFPATSSEIAKVALDSQYSTEQKLFSTREHCLTSMSRDAQWDRHETQESTARKRKENHWLSFFFPLLPYVPNSSRCPSVQLNNYRENCRF